MKRYKKKTMNYGIVIALMGLFLLACDKDVEKKVVYQVAVRNELSEPVRLSVYQGGAVREWFYIKPDSIRVVFSRSSTCVDVGAPKCTPDAPLPFSLSDSVVLLMNDRQKVYNRSDIPLVGDPMRISSFSNRDSMSYQIYTYGKSAHPDGGYSVDILRRGPIPLDTNTYVYRVTDSLYAASIPITE